MKKLLRYRAMESVCRQRATFCPEESWKWLAEAEMWNHKAFGCPDRPETSSVGTRSPQRRTIPAICVIAPMASVLDNAAR